MTRHRPKFRRAAALAVVAIVAATSLGASGAEASAPDEPASSEAIEPSGTGRVAMLVDRQSYDPHRSEIGNFLQYLQPVYDTLMRMTADGEIVAMLATSWEYVDDTNTLLELELRDDVTFVDGEEFNADVVKANIERGHEVPGPRAHALASVEEVEVVDPTTVRLHLAAPDPMLLMELTSVMAMMISPAAFDNENLDLVPVGSGPYLFDEEASTAGDVYVYHANPDYWDPTIPRLEHLELRVMLDADARLNALMAGQIDQMPGTTEQIAQAEGAGLTALTELVGWIGFSLADREGTAVPALADPLVRQAMNYAVDRDAIVEALAQGHGRATTQIFPPNSPAVTEEVDAIYSYDPDRARDLLAEAGYAEGFSFPVSTNARRQTYVEAVAGYLAEVGITVDIELIDAGFIETWMDGNHPVPNVIYGARHPYEMTNLFLLPDGAFNPYGTTDQAVIDLYEQAVAAPDEEAQTEIWIDISRHVTEQAWFLVTHYEEVATFVGPNLQGVETYPSQAVPSIYGWHAES